jgi:class 3 adenylate cyclase
MSRLPSGIVALLMTDVEGSSTRWNTSPDEMEAAICALDREITMLVQERDGHVIKARGEGDSHFAVFARSTDAISAAAAVQRRRDRDLDLRACVVIGELSPRDGDYVGEVVNHGARIRSVAHARQVLITSGVVELVRGRLPRDLGVRSLGTHRVRDVPGAVELFQLTGPGLRRTFPPLRTPAFSMSTLMTVVSIDEAGSMHRLDSSHDDVLEWQREVIRSLRSLSDAHDGRYLKLLGDGCIVGFEDPRAALAFAEAAQQHSPYRIGIAVGLVDAIEGELIGLTLYEAHQLMRQAAPGETRCSPMVENLRATAWHPRSSATEPGMTETRTSRS